MHSSSTLAVDRFINATRINIASRVKPEMYQSTLSNLSALASRLDLSTEFKIVYSASRRVELVALSGVSWIIYDQYMGQTMNLLNRIFIEAEDKQPSLVYFHKVLAERLLEAGRLEEALHCATIYHNNREDLNLKRLNEEWRFLLIEVHEAFLLHHEFGHVVFSKETLFPITREHASQIIEDLIKSKQRSIEKVIEDARNAPPAAIHHQKIDDFILSIQELERGDNSIIDAQIAYLNAPQTLEEVFCDIFAADLVLNLEIQKGRDIVKVLRAIYIGFYHMQAIEYLRRFPNLSNKDPNWSTDTIPQVQARAQCLRGHLAFLYQAHLYNNPESISTDTEGEVLKFQILLMDDQKRYYEVIYDGAMALCDNLRKNNWIIKLGRKATKKLHRKIGYKKGDAYTIDSKSLRAIVLFMTGWIDKPSFIDKWMH